MSGGSRGSVVRSIQTLIDAGTVAGMTDGQLLERFLERQGPAAEPAFAALVKLHGPMVWGVCRGALADLHDAEDAFQATFLILVRKAGTVRRRDTLGPWLYGVARRVAVRAKEVRRRRREHGGAEIEATIMPDQDRCEAVEALHQELDRLPEKYRAVVVLCHLEGRTQAEAARLLGCPIGTVGVRVARARDILRDRLTRRGMALPAALAGAALAPSTTTASAVPAALAASTIRAALQVAAGKSLAAGCVSAAVSHLTQGVLKTMTLTKLTIASSCVMTAGIVSTSVGWVAMGDNPAQTQAQTGKQPRTKSASPPIQQHLGMSRLIGMNNLRMIGLALAQYAEANGGRYPAAAAYRREGKPLLSWRVAILPYLGNDALALFNRFKLDEPWDGPHNQSLLNEMPNVYAPVVDRAAPKSSTYFQVFVGPGSVFGKERSVLTSDVLMQSVILTVVEAATPVPWTKPEDLAFDPAGRLPQLGGQFDQGFLALFAYRNVRFLNRKLDPEVLRHMIRCDDNTPFNATPLNSPDPSDPREFGSQ